jgi:hypothetical protein
MRSDFKQASTSNGMEWKFNNNITSLLLIIMNITMFISVYDNNNKLDKINKLAMLLFITLILSYIMNNSNVTCNINRPSIWCLSSAIVAPIMLFI